MAGAGAVGSIKFAAASAINSLLAVATGYTALEKLMENPVGVRTMVQQVFNVNYPGATILNAQQLGGEAAQVENTLLSYENAAAHAEAFKNALSSGNLNPAAQAFAKTQQLFYSGQDCSNWRRFAGQHSYCLNHLGKSRPDIDSIEKRPHTAKTFAPGLHTSSRTSKPIAKLPLACFAASR